MNQSFATQRQLPLTTTAVQAVEAMAAAISLPQALVVIAAQARALFGAHAAVVWGYDGERHKFIAKAVQADGLTPEEFAALHALELSPGVITNTILREGEVVVSDLAQSALPPAGAPVREWLEKTGIRSYCGIKLQVGDIVTGFLYLCYTAPRGYDENERQRQRHFAVFAALALRKAALLEQMSEVKGLAGTVTRVLTAGNVTHTLRLIVEEGRRVLRCDAMTLYPYDELKKELGQVPTTAGLDFPERTATLPTVPVRSIIYQMLNRDDPCIVPCVAEDERFRNRRFTLDEGIKSLVAFPLRAHGRRTGVIFFNYRTERSFAKDELDNIGMFADLAALAVHNAQVQEERAADLSKQVLLAYLSREFLTATDQQDILSRTVEVARSILQTEFASIVLTDTEGHLLTIATAGWEKGIAGHLRPGDGLNSHAGYTIQHRVPVRVLDYKTEQRFEPPAIVFDKKICSGISAPLTLAGGVTGALLAQTKKPREFSNEEERLLRLLADEISIAIKSLQKEKDLEAISKKATAHAELARAGIKDVTLAHEIYNAMGLIRVQLEELFDSSTSERLIPDWMEHYLEVIKTETLRLIELSKLPAAEEGLEEISLKPFIKQCLDALKKSELYRGLELKLTGAESETPVVVANPRWLRVVLENLLKNAALEISKPDVICHTITVQVQLEGNFAEIIVMDGGHGIPADAQTSFRQGQKAAQRPTGLGIGLLKARFIAEIYGGSIEIIETGSAGTKMCIRLPLAQPAQARASQAAATTHAPGASRGV